MDSSVTTRSCGRVRMWTWQCRWCRKRRHCTAGVAGEQFRSGAFIAATIGSASMRCSTLNALPGRVDIFQEPTAPRTGRGGVVCCRAACASGDRVCHQWVGAIGDSTEFAAMVRTASRVRLPCRCMAANLHRIGLILQKRERKRSTTRRADQPRPDNASWIPSRQETARSSCPWKQDITRTLICCPSLSRSSSGASVAGVRAEHHAQACHELAQISARNEGFLAR